MRASLTANLGSVTRRTGPDGRRYLVAPISLIVPGVLNGSKGALFYPEEEVAKEPQVWDNTPIVVDHPHKNGVPISANSPAILNSQGIGFLLNSRYSKGKLRADGWFDEERTRGMFPEIYQRLTRNQKIEVSTGLFTDNSPAPTGAVYKGRGYQYIARNYKPDHLAILPNQTGACSLQDGCGVLANSQRQITKERAMRKRVHNASKTKDSSTMTKKRLTANKRTELIDTIIANVCCFDENDRTILNSLSDDKLLRMAHEGELEPSNNKKEAVANADVENKKKAKDDDPCAKEGMTAEEVQNCKEKQKMAANALTPEQLEDLAFAKQVKQERKDAAIAVITANKQNPWKAEELQAMPLDQLQKLATIAKVDAPAPLPKVLPNFRGAAVPATNAGNDQEDKDDMLPLPTINWGEWAASKN